MRMCVDCGWEEFLEDIEILLGDGRYGFAIDTLEGIQEWVSDAEHCTVAQREAVENISRSVEDRE